MGLPDSERLLGASGRLCLRTGRCTTSGAPSTQQRQQSAKELRQGPAGHRKELLGKNVERHSGVGTCHEAPYRPYREGRCCPGSVTFGDRNRRKPQAAEAGQ